MIAEAIRKHLPQVCPTEARARTRLLSLLAHAGLRARPLTHEPASAGQRTSAVWVSFAADCGEVRLAPLMAAGRPVAVRAVGGRIDATAVGAALQACEPLITALEAALETPLVPRALHATASHNACQVVVETKKGDSVWLSLDAMACERLPEPRMTALPHWLHPVRLPCRIALGACLLTRTEWLGLEDGDVLLPSQDSPQAWPVRATVHGQRREATALFLPRQGRLEFRNEEHHPMSDPNAGRTMTEPTDSQDTRWETLPVRVRFELPRVSLPLGVLAGLQPGAVIDIARSAQTISIDLLTDDRLIGRGEIVALGDGFGVRVRELIAAPR
ncbi:MAG: FliM/FliN family flagellar motor switch protein [Burkholderiales bacterium]|nr:FliM/FliN family flagellar motor switch protein [Burkholderiales bacterium]